MFKPVLLVAFVVTICSSAIQAQPQLPFPLPPKPPLGEQPPGPEQLLEQLLQKLYSGDELERLAAAESLPDFGSFAAQKATGALAKALDDDSQHVRYAALFSLGAIGRDAKQALPAIRARVEEAGSDYERTLAAWATTRVSPNARQIADLTPLLIKSLASSDMAVNSRAVEALVNLGRVAHPALAKALESADARTTFLILDILGRTGARTQIDAIATHLDNNSSMIRARAAQALGEIGPAAKTQTAKLTNLLASDDSAAVRARAATALGDIGVATEDSTAALSDAIENDKSDVVVREAIEALSKTDAGANVLLQRMPDLLQDGRATVVTQAMSALANLGDGALPLLKQSLAKKETRYWSLLVIADLGPSAKLLVPTLAEIYPEANTLDKREILMALASIGEGAIAAVPQIADALKHTDAGVRYAATFAAGEIGAKDDAVITALKANANSDDAILKMTSAWALAKLQPSNPLAGLTAVRELAAGMANDDPNVQQMAAQCLANLDLGPAQAPQLLPQITKAFGSADPQAQLAAVDAVESLLSGVDPSRMLNTLLKAEGTRPLAAVAAARIGEPANGATGALADALTDDRPAVRRDVAVALAAIGPEAEAAVPALQNALASDVHSDVRHAAAYALGRIGPAAAGATKILIDALDDSSTTAIAAWALAHVAPNDAAVARAAVPQLINGLDLNDVAQREQAAHALAQFGPRASTARDALVYASEDPSPIVRAAATAALKAIARE